MKYVTKDTYAFKQTFFEYIIKRLKKFKRNK